MRLVPDRTPTGVQVVAPDAHKRWKPDGHERAITLIRERERVQYRPFYCKNRQCNGQPHRWPRDQRECPWRFGHVWDEDIDYNACLHCAVPGDPLDEWQFPHARLDQRPPNWKDPNWLLVLLRGGRGSGKTRTGSEITNKVTELTPRIILIAATGPDLRNTMVEGESGILASSPPGKRPIWEPSKKRLTWPNGCIAEGFSAEEPDRLRGPQSGYVWADEPSHYPLVETVWDMMLFGLRIKGAKGYPLHVAATSTPKPNPWTKARIAEDDTVDRVVSSYANIHNLADVFKNKVIKRFENTRTGAQELEGQILEDVEGALWNYGMLLHIAEAPPLARVVVAVDPAGTANKKSDETGIMVVGVGHNKHLYVLADYTGKFSPDGWSKEVMKAHETWDADAIVAEKNYGGDMVKNIIEREAKDQGILVRVIEVTSRKGKDIRAEPIVALYEKQKVYHVGQRGDLETFEDEITTWVPHESPSPNRLDAMVHGLTHLAKGVEPAAVSDPRKVLAGYRAPTNRHLRAV